MEKAYQKSCKSVNNQPSWFINHSFACRVDGMVKVWNDAYAFAVMTGAI